VACILLVVIAIAVTRGGDAVSPLGASAPSQELWGLSATEIEGGRELAGVSHRELPEHESVPRGLHETNAIIECLRSNAEDEVLKCLEGKVGSQDAQWLKDVICSRLPEVIDAAKWTLASTVIRAWDPTEALAQMWNLDGSCEALIYSSDGWSVAIARLAETDPQWLETFADSLTLEVLCGEEKSPFGVRLVGQLVVEGIDSLAGLLEEAAIGGNGTATAEQMIEGIMFGSLARPDPTERLLFLDRVVSGERIGEQPKAAGMAAIYALRPDSWIEGDSRTACSVVRGMLMDERIAVDVALHILMQFRAEPKEGVDPDAWGWVWADCRSVADRAGYTSVGQ
jgi:hypothetical protein